MIYAGYFTDIKPLAPDGRAAVTEQLWLKITLAQERGNLELGTLMIYDHQQTGVLRPVPVAVIAELYKSAVVAHSIGEAMGGWPPMSVISLNAERLAAARGYDFMETDYGPPVFYIPKQLTIIQHRNFVADLYEALKL